MEWIEIGTLFLIYFAAMICNKLTTNINPLVWLAGMTAEIVYMAMGIAHYSWLESLITFGVSLILAVILYSRLTNSFGGGGIKGLIMSGLYLGRYLAVLLVILYLLCVLAHIMKKLSKKTAEYTVPGELTVSIMPFIIIAAGLTVGIQYWIGY